MRLVAGLALTALLAGCSAAGESAELKALSERVAKLEAQAQRSADVIEIWKLQSLYQHHMLRGDGVSIVGLFADSPDVEIELSNKGILRGADAPARYWLRAKSGEATPTSSPARAPGSLIFHTAINPVIEISADGLHAKALWLSPGITTRGGATVVGNWNYGKYGMEYVKQNGEWKILAFRWHQIFLTPYDKGWDKVTIDPGNGPEQPQADKPSAADFYRPYRPSEANPFDPPPPAPYEAAAK